MIQTKQETMEQTLLTERDVKRKRIAEGRQKYLKKKKVYLKPIEGKDLTLIKSNKNFSAHGFMYEGAIYDRCLPLDSHMNYFDPFDSDEEREYFELETGRNLGLDYRVPDCAWNTTKEGIRVKFNVTNSIKNVGYELDLSTPYGVLEYKIVKMQRDTAPSYKERFNRSHYVWCIVDGEEEKTEKREAFELNSKLYRYFGSIEGSTDKMKDFLRLYYMSNKEPKEVGNNSDDALKSEIQDLIEKFPAKVLRILNDPDAEVKAFILKAVKCKAIEKTGANSYTVAGKTGLPLEDTIAYVKKLEEVKDTDDSYGIILHRIQIAEGK